MQTDKESMQTDKETSTSDEEVRSPVLEWEGAPTISFKGKRDWHYKHERLTEEPDSSAYHTVSPKQVALRRIVQVAPNHSSPSTARRQHSRETRRSKEFRDMHETITVQASEFKKYGNDVNQLRNCRERSLSKEVITVHASDFKKHGGDVNQLRNCQIETLKHQSESHEPEEYLDNPWAGKTKQLHYLLLREDSQDESGINQKWFPPPTLTGRYETPSPGPKRRYYDGSSTRTRSSTSTRTSSPAVAPADLLSPPRAESRKRGRAPSPGCHHGRPVENSPQKCKSSNVYVASPCLPPRSPLDSHRRRREPHSSTVIEGRPNSQGRQPSILATAVEAQTLRLPPRLPQRGSTPKLQELV